MRAGAVELLDAMRGGRLSAETLMAQTLERIARVNPQLNAIVSLRDADVLMDEARAADGAAPRGPLHGLPMAVKDLEDVAGLPTSQGSPLYAGDVAARDGLLAARLRAAGAILIGKTNVPEFGLGSHSYNPVFGPCRNPYDPTRAAGGSSGGAAVALATGMVALADGSDMMGSLRNPAGWNNVYGMRPTWGLVPGDGDGDLFLHRLSSNGPMARSPRDLALLLDVIAGPDARQPPGPVHAPLAALVEASGQGTRIAWAGDWGGAWAMEAGVLDTCEAALAGLTALGASVEAVAPPFPADALWRSWCDLRAFAVTARLGNDYADPARRAQLKPEAVWEVERGLALGAQEIQAASSTRSDWFRAALALFERYDVLALPSAQLFPFPVDWHWPREVGGQAMDSYHRWMEVVVPASLIGLPAISVPAGFGPGGLPMGLQLIGPPGSDLRLLRLAQAWHEASDWPNRRPPPLPAGQGAR